jgi:anti-sigma B factor antagonist
MVIRVAAEKIESANTIDVSDRKSRPVSGVASLARGGGWPARLALLREPEVRGTYLHGDVAVVSLLGEHDAATAWEVRNVLTLALIEQGAHLVVDLSETQFIDSSIIHVLFESGQLAREHGRRVSLQMQADGGVRRALEISGALEALPVYETRAEAINAVRQDA